VAKARTAPITINVAAGVKADVNVTLNVHEQKRRPLRFGAGNAKLSPAILTFSLPAGHSCPHAKDCKSKAHRIFGTIRDGSQTTFRCYAASMEARHGSVRRSRWHNYDSLLACGSKREMTRLILDSLTIFAGYVRIHDSGDFFSQDYFDSWLEVARQRPRTHFYAYVKALPFWVQRLDEVGTGYKPGEIPNLVLTASYGGSRDELITRHGLRYARVVHSEAEAEELGLELDHDDSHAIQPGSSFALLIHGTQPAGTDAAQAVRELRNQGEFGYGYRAEAIRIKVGRRPLTVSERA
jgi:Gene product 88